MPEAFVSPLFAVPHSALVTNNVVEDNARAGIFFHRSTDNAEAYGNVCRRNLEGDFGIVESMGVKVHDNIMEVLMSGAQRLCSLSWLMPPLWAAEAVLVSATPHTSTPTAVRAR